MSRKKSSCSVKEQGKSAPKALPVMHALALQTNRFFFSFFFSKKLSGSNRRRTSFQGDPVHRRNGAAVKSDAFQREALRDVVVRS